MTTIKKLSIQGIRSYSDQSVESIEFFKPLTIIVGANGSGKTTIIEALKYICTGSQPPLSEGGKSFVHDPKLGGTHLVKAQIKLGFRTADGRPVLAIRSFQLAVKREKREYKHLESVLRTIGADGREISISHVCANMEKQVPLLMGVSAAVLENVIFCHQEDSNWPLGESRLLKLKFDDIFAATRYTKALEVIRKERAERMKQCTQMKADLTVLENDLEIAHKLEDDLAAAQTDLAANRKKEVDLDEVFRELREQMNVLQAKADAASQVSRDIRELSTKLEIAVEEVEKAYAEIVNEYAEESDEELLKFQSRFAAEINEAQKRHRLARAENASCSSDLARVEKERHALILGIGKMNAEKEAHKKNTEKLNELCETIVRSFPDLAKNVSHTSSNIVGQRSEPFIESTAHAYELFQKASQAHLFKLTSDLQTLREGHALESEKLAADTSSKRVTLGSLRTEHSYKVKAIMTLRERLKRVQLSLQEYNADGHTDKLDGAMDIKPLEDEAKRAEHELASFVAEVNEASMTACIKATQDKLSALAPRREALVQERGQLSRLREALDRVRFKREHLAKLQANVMKERMDVVKSCALWCRAEGTTGTGSARAEDLPNLSLPDLLKAIDEADREARNESSVAKTNHATAQEGLNKNVFSLLSLKRQLDALTRDRARHKHAAEELLKKEGHDGDAGAPLDIFGDGYDLVAETDQLRKVQSKLKIRFDVLSGARKMYRRFIEQAQNDHICTLCQRGLNASELEEFLKLNQAKLDNEEQERRLAAVQQERSRVERRLAMLSSVADAWSGYKRCCDEMPRLQAEMRSLEGVQRDELHAVAEATQAKLDMAEVRHRNIMASQNAARAAVKLLEEADALQVAIHLEEAPLTNSAGAAAGDGSKNSGTAVRSFASCSADIEALDAERAGLDALLEKQRSGREAMVSKRLKLQDAVSRAKEAAMHFKQRCVEYERLQKENGDVTQLLKDAEEAVSSLDARVDAAVRDVEAACRVRDSVRSANDSKESELQDVVNRLRRSCQTFTPYYREVMKYEAPASKKERESRASRLTEKEEKMTNLEQRLRLSLEAIERAKEKLDKLEKARLDVDANIAYRRRVNTRNGLESQLGVLKVRESSLAGGLDVLTEISRLREQLTKVQTARAEVRGEMAAQSQQVSRLQDNLKAEKFQNVDDRCRSKMIEVHTTTMAAADLDTYYKVLDKALLRYHSLKMREINDTLKELWRLTYRGRDIEEVYIRTEETVIKSGRRNYNYRVAMKQGDSELDMRGRCSAGQKVLACLLIRLALAETFCLQCGVLALDEPTTNLDARNIKSFARALSSIIEKRRQQRNFQLIIITHDEHFVNEIGKRSLCDYYYRTYKDDDNKSRIAKRRINE